MRILRQNLTLILLLTCGIYILALANACFAGVSNGKIPGYSYKCAPLPPTTQIYKLSPGTTNPVPIQCMKRLPDGAVVQVHRKTIVGYNQNDMFIEEADRSSGIRVNFGLDYTDTNIVPGNTVTFKGVMTTIHGERAISPQSAVEYDYNSHAPISALGMPSPAIVGWPVNKKDPQGPRTTGLAPVGLLVSIWGKVHGMGSMDYDMVEGYFYLDDGWGKSDGNVFGFPGIRVCCDGQPGIDGDLLIATGVCSTLTYDPVPSDTGDEFIIPVIRTIDASNIRHPDQSSVPTTTSPVSGRVRLVGQAAPGVDVRVYSETGSAIVKNVTDEWQPYTLPDIRTTGNKISASATGYISSTVDAFGGQNDVDIELEPSQLYVEMSCDRTSLRVCSDDVATTTCFLRDAEGKGMSRQKIKVTTSLGSFVGTNTRDAVITTDDDGFAQVQLKASPDGDGVASVRAEGDLAGSISSQISVAFEGPKIQTTASPNILSNAGSSVVTARVIDGDNPVANCLVTFKTDWGTFKETGAKVASALTNNDGYASTTLQITSPGSAKVMASHADFCGHSILAWVIVSYGAQPWYNQGVQGSNPLVVNLNGDSTEKDVVVVTWLGDMIALDTNGAVLWTVPMHPNGSNTPSSVILDNERSGLPCITIPAESQQKVYVYNHNGYPMAGWPAGTDYRFVKCAAAIADANLDGSPEIIAGDESCYVFSWSPVGDWKGTGTSNSSFLWRNLTGSSSTAIYGSTCAVGDIDGDALGMPDVVVGTNRYPEVFAFPGDAWGDYGVTPLYLDGWPKPSNARAETSPAIGDIDGDNLNDVVIGSDDGNIYVWLSAKKYWAAYYIGGLIKSSPALADIDGDGKLDIVVGSDSGRLFVLNSLGQTITGWAGGIQLNCSGTYAIESSPVIGDINGDGQVEVVVGCNDGNVYAIYKDGMDHVVDGAPAGPIAWVGSCIPPGQLSASVTSSPVIDDIDGDGKIEIVAAGDKGVYVFHLDAPYSNNPALFPWPTFHHDNQRTGCSTPPRAPIRASIQGIVTKGGQPLLKASVEIYYSDGTKVPQPFVTPSTPRPAVLTVGNSSIYGEAGEGAYSINQLEPNRTYKLKVSATGLSDKWIDVPVTTGLTRADVAF